MDWNRHRKFQAKRLRAIGIIFVLLAFGFTAFGYFSEMHAKEREGFYMVSGILMLMGMYSLGAVWRKRMFLR